MKKTIYKSTYILIFLLILSTGLQAKSNGWESGVKKNGVKAFYQISSYQNEPVVFIKFVNKNKKPVTVTWNEEIKFEGASEALTVNPSQLNLTIEPGTIQGESIMGAPVLQLVSRPSIMLADKRKIIDFSFKNLEVIK